jgi:hypothetical protein
VNGADAQHLVLEAKLFLLQLVKHNVIWVGPLFFGIDAGLKRGVLGCEIVGNCVVHVCHSPFCR